LKRAKLQEWATADLQYAEVQIKIIRRQIREYATRSTESRKQWLEGLAEAKALELLADEELETREGERKLKEKTRKMLTEMLRREEQRRYARVIKWEDFPRKDGGREWK
jgi:hypothetical protein